VAAIERTSQFSRLPGVDTDRVIFSHRIVAVAGGRFHVLSAIRDSGADYTGRTNHIAHHLIVDPREIAQMGGAGISPAEVLLSFPWKTSWSENPRYFEENEAVSLGNLRANSRSGGWQRLTGNAQHAWLLAAGEASRGAYLVQPAGADLRECFAESLRLIPERLWQIAFTTSLQPSDEPADFRWIGIEERSPLRAQVESSGRPVLNLTLPATLPQPEIPEVAPVVEVVETQFLRGGGGDFSSSPEVAEDIPTEMLRPPPGGGQQPFTERAPSKFPSPFKAPKSPRRSPSVGGANGLGKKGFPWLPVAVGVVGLVVVGVGWFVYDQSRKGDSGEAGETTSAGAMGIVAAYQAARPDLGGKATVDLQGLSAGDLARIDALAKRGQTMAEAMHSATLTAAGSPAKFAVIEQAKEAFEVERKREPRLAQPQPFLKDFDQIKSRLDLAVELANFAPNGEAGNFQKIEGLVRDLGLNPAVGGGGNGDDHSTHPQLFRKLQEVLKKIAAQKEAEGLIALLKLKGEAAPTPEGKTGQAAYDWFLEKQKVAIALEPAFPSADELEQILHDWKAADSKGELPSDFGQRATKHLWPRWLSKRYEERGKGGGSAVVTAPVVPVPVPTPTPPPPPPAEVAKKALPTLYFFKENGDLTVAIPEGEGVTIWLRTGGLGQEESEMKAFSTTLQLGPRGDYFDKAGGILKMASKPPTPPYRLVIKHKEEERARIFMGAPHDADEVLEKLGVELSLTAEGKIAGTLPKLAGKPGEELIWVVQYSGKALGVAKDGEFKVGPDGQCDLGPVKAELQRMVAAKEKEKAALVANKSKVLDASATNQKTPKHLGESALISANIIIEVNKRGEKIKIFPLVSIKPFAEAISKIDSVDKNNIEDVIKKIDNLMIAAGKLQNSGKDGMEQEPMKAKAKKIEMDCMSLKTAIDINKSTNSESINNKYLLDVRNIESELNRLNSLPLLKDNRLPAGDYPLCIKPPQSWNTSGWGLVPVKTLKVP
jgi:hypothetical protein